jgi:hypothetical protein
MRNAYIEYTYSIIEILEIMGIICNLTFIIDGT